MSCEPTYDLQILQFKLTTKHAIKNSIKYRNINL